METKLGWATSLLNSYWAHAPAGGVRHGHRVIVHKRNSFIVRINWKLAPPRCFRVEAAHVGIAIGFCLLTLVLLLK